MKKYFGYIEGYYGRVLTWEQRFALLDHLRSLSMNTYFYAPKEDPLHRLQWKIKYPPAWQENFKRFVSSGKRKKITVIPALAPGLSYDYLSKKDYNHLVNKLKSFLRAGADTLALLMDDIPESLPDACKTNFNSLGQAHGLLLKKLFADLRTENPKASLWFCPTIYSDHFVKGHAVNSTYINDLAATMPEAVTLMWTGPQVISEKLTHNNLRGITKVFKGNLVIWDNYYANDYAPLRLFIGPYKGRENSITNITKGILLNPTGLFCTDKLLLSLFADFLKNKKATAAGWCRVVKEHAVPDAFFTIKKFFLSPFYKPSMKDFSKDALIKYHTLLDELLVAWQSPLKREWYPYLQSFKQDIDCLRINKKSQKSWRHKHYPPLIALRMDKH